MLNDLIVYDLPCLVHNKRCRRRRDQTVGLCAGCLDSSQCLQQPSGDIHYPLITHICQFLERVSGLITSLPLLSIIPLFALVLLSLSNHPFPPGPSSPHHVLIFLPLCLPSFTTPEATGVTVNSFGPYRGNGDWELSDGEQCPEHNCPLFSTVFCFLFVSALWPPVISRRFDIFQALHLLALQTLLSVCLFCALFIAIFSTSFNDWCRIM